MRFPSIRVPGIAFMGVVGDMVHPTGRKNGVWRKVDDDTGDRGWAPSPQLGPK